MEVLDYQIWNNSLQRIAVAFLAFTAVYFLLPILKKYLVKNLRKIARKTETQVDDLLVDLVKNLPSVFVFALALFVAIQFLSIPFALENWINIFILAIFVWEVVQIANQVLMFTLNNLAKRKNDSAGIIHFSGVLLKIVIWSIALLFLLQNLGVNVSSLITGLGIGGIAIALAVQSILSDMFSSFSIFLDQPFKVGDYITVGNQRGTVKKIGIKTTRLESLTGEELVIPNQDLTSSRLQNFKKMKKRRGDFVLGVEYSTTQEKLKKIPDIIRKIKIKDLEIARVCFASFGDFSLNFEVVFWVNSQDYDVFCGLREQLNYAINEAFAKEKIVFAFPTQTVFVEK